MSSLPDHFSTRKPLEGQTLVRSIGPCYDGRFLNIRWTDWINYPRVYSFLAYVTEDGIWWHKDGAYLSANPVHPSIARAIATWEHRNGIACRDSVGRPMFADGTGGLCYDRREAAKKAESTARENVRAWQNLARPFGGSFSL